MRIGKREQYQQELRRLIVEKVPLKGFNKQVVANAIAAKEEFERTQTILKRPTRISDSNVWGLCCAAWFDLLLETDYHSRFKTFKELEDLAWRLLTPAAYTNGIAADLPWINLWRDYEPLLRDWYYKSHQEEKQAIDFAVALIQMQKMSDGVKNAMFEMMKEEK